MATHAPDKSMEAPALPPLESGNLVTLSTLVVVAIVGYVMGLDWSEAHVTVANGVRVGVFAVFCVSWVFVTQKLATPTDAMKKFRRTNLNDAIPLQAKAGASMRHHDLDGAL